MFTKVSTKASRNLLMFSKRVNSQHPYGIVIWGARENPHLLSSFPVHEVLWIRTVLSSRHLAYMSVSYRFANKRITINNKLTSRKSSPTWIVYVILLTKIISLGKESEYFERLSEGVGRVSVRAKGEKRNPDGTRVLVPSLLVIWSRFKFPFTRLRRTVCKFQAYPN